MLLTQPHREEVVVAVVRTRWRCPFRFTSASQGNDDFQSATCSYGSLGWGCDRVVRCSHRQGARGGSIVHDVGMTNIRSTSPPNSRRLRPVAQPGADPYSGLVPVQQRGMTVWAERRPSHCPAGHRLAAGPVLVGWLPCRCQWPALGHRTWLCRLVVDGRECGLVISVPRHDQSRLG
jgi:hypothetical protein